jgi:hypothetical protein
MCSFEQPSGVEITGEVSQSSDDELEHDARLLELTRMLVAQDEFAWGANSHLTLRRQSLSRILYYDHLYQKVVGTPGVICEFGVRWGATLALLANLRGIYEPYNYSRKIVGFDTFEGFPTVHTKDGIHVRQGAYSVWDGYEKTLAEILVLHESFSPIPHVRKFELVKGDASKTIDSWLKDNPHAIISMAIFDMDIYDPIKAVLNKILPRLTKGSILVFDELNHELFPGETVALDEVLGINNLRLQHFPDQPQCAWAVFGE